MAVQYYVLLIGKRFRMCSTEIISVAEPTNFKLYFVLNPFWAGVQSSRGVHEISSCQLKANPSSSCGAVRMFRARGVQTSTSPAARGRCTARSMLKTAW